MNPEFIGGANSQRLHRVHSVVNGVETIPLIIVGNDALLVAVAILDFLSNHVIQLLEGHKLVYHMCVYLVVFILFLFEYHFLECLGDCGPALINDFGEVSLEHFFDIIDAIGVECVNVPIGISDIIRIS